MKYPTQEELDHLSKIDPFKPQEMVSYLEDIWQWPELVQTKGKTLTLVTGGWSGNEDIIYALSNTMFWSLYWEKSERGGKYTFKLND